MLVLKVCFISSISLESLLYQEKQIVSKKAIKMWIAMGLCILIAAVPCYSRLNFTGHKVYSIYLNEEHHLNFFKDLQKNMFRNKLDVWNDPTTPDHMVNVRVPPLLASDFEEQMTSVDMKYDTIIHDLQELMTKELEENPLDDALAGWQENFAVDVYHSFDAICAFLDAIGNRYSSIATVKQIGTTFEGNPIKGLKIGSPGLKKPAIWIDAGIHAREWIAPATAIYIIDQLVKGYFEEGNTNIKCLVDTFDWYIFPVINVDGYIYTWTFDRTWRKNTVPKLNDFNSDPSCVGIDPNRNFDSAFGGDGTSDDPCSESYSGEFPFSEAESRAIRDGVLEIGNDLKAYVTLHAFSQLLMAPYGYTEERCADYQDQINALQAMSEAIANTHSVKYKFGPISTTIYPASGNAVDWTYDVANVKYSFTIEERDTGKEGFMLHKRQIVPTGEEIWAAVTVLAGIIKKEL